MAGRVIALVIMTTEWMGLFGWLAMVGALDGAPPARIFRHDSLDSMNAGPAVELLTIPGVAQRLELYASAARAADAAPVVRLRLRENCSEKILRNLLRELAKENIGDVRVEFLKKEAAEGGEEAVE